MDTEELYLAAFAANIRKLGTTKLLTPIEHAIATATFDRIINASKDILVPVSKLMSAADSSELPSLTVVAPVEDSKKGNSNSERNSPSVSVSSSMSSK